MTLRPIFRPSVGLLLDVRYAGLCITGLLLYLANHRRPTILGQAPSDPWVPSRYLGRPHGVVLIRQRQAAQLGCCRGIDSSHSRDPFLEEYTTLPASTVHLAPAVADDWSFNTQICLPAFIACRSQSYAHVGAAGAGSCTPMYMYSHGAP
ncbi:hypothetical protein LZ30DRAFT_692134 [Colletotrichum cereale]|nr:hypothetical protein LZ30DRAFT_692134 [Colletotrichum cereale]